MNKNEYKEALDKIVISDELREKIIHNSSETHKHIHTRNNTYRHFRKMAGIAACFAFCMLSYYTVTNYYHFSADTPINTTPPPVQIADNSNSFDTDNNDIRSVAPDTNDIQNNTNVSTEQHLSNNTNTSNRQHLYNNTNTSNEQHLSNNTNNTETAVNSDNYHMTNNSVNADNSVNTNNTANVDNSIPSSGANQGTQSNSIDTEDIEQDDFPPVLSAAPSIDNDISVENAANIENAGAVCSGYERENMSAISEIEHELGYDIKVPNYIPEGYKTDSLSAPFGEFAEITYTNETDTLYYRTAKSSEDISGDYNDYSKTETLVINDNDVTIKGNNELYHNASWFDGDEAFSIYSDNGIERDTIIAIVESID